MLQYFILKSRLNIESVRLGSFSFGKSCATFSDLQESEIELHRAFEAAAKFANVAQGDWLCPLIIEKSFHHEQI